MDLNLGGDVLTIGYWWVSETFFFLGGAFLIPSLERLVYTILTPDGRSTHIIAPSLILPILLVTLTLFSLTEGRTTPDAAGRYDRPNEGNPLFQ